MKLAEVTGYLERDAEERNGVMTGCEHCQSKQNVEMDGELDKIYADFEGQMAEALEQSPRLRLGNQG